MSIKLPIWETLGQSFSFVRHHMPLFLRALAVPVFLLIVISLLFLGELTGSMPPVLWIRDLVTVVIFSWMMNVCCRIVITETAGDNGWTTRENWTFVWLLCLSFVITVMSAFPALILYIVLVNVDPIVATILAVIAFLLLHLYLFARFVLVFPATAMGDPMSFREAWEISAGNGWRLVILFALIPLLYMLVAMGLIALLPIQLFAVVLSIIGIFFMLVGVVAVSLAYKTLKGKLL